MNRTLLCSEKVQRSCARSFGHIIIVIMNAINVAVVVVFVFAIAEYIIYISSAFDTQHRVRSGKLRSPSVIVSVGSSSFFNMCVLEKSRRFFEILAKKIVYSSPKQLYTSTTNLELKQCHNAI